VDSSSTVLLKTPLHDMHVALGARMVEFAGWSMPVMFTSIADEHVHTRTACSVFDVSHMGRLTLTGRDGEALLNRICTRNLLRAEVGRSYYSHICREDGGILDDVIVSRFEDRWGVVCNGSNRAKIVAWIQKHALGTDVALEDQTVATTMLAIQGPRTLELAEDLSGLDFSSLKRYRFREHDYLGSRLIVYRSGYTGEDGLEIVFPAESTEVLLPMLLGTERKPHPVIKPAGLGARDTLRIEAAMPLYGHELSEEFDSLTAGQAWCVDLNKDFIGAASMRELQRAGLRRRLVGLAVEGRRIARQNQCVSAKGRPVGKITSGTLSPTLGKSIAMGFVEFGLGEPGATLEVAVGNKPVNTTVVPLPFYKRPAGP